MAAILLVEDEATIAESVKYALETEGYDVSVANDGRTALELAESESPDLVLLDLMLPEMSGFDVCRLMRDRWEMPIVIISAKDSEADIVAGLELGADDFVTKPFSMRILLSRIRANLRRGEISNAVEGDSLEVGPLQMDVERHEVLLSGEPISMRPKEFDLLQVLMEESGRLVRRQALLDRVWGYDFYGDTKTLDVHIRRLREKIERDPQNPELLTTIRGLGYKLSDEST